MKQEDDTLKTAFEEELKAIENNPILSAKFRRQKTIMWTIRTLIAIILYILETSMGTLDSNRIYTIKSS